MNGFLNGLKNIKEFNNLKTNKIMKNKELVISVSGKTNTGKSRLTLLLKKFLRENGFEVKFDGGQDFEDEVKFDEQISKNLEQAIETIKETSVVTLKEEQI